jgi:hypothetical protein
MWSKKPPASPGFDDQAALSIAVNLSPAKTWLLSSEDIDLSGHINNARPAGSWLDIPPGPQSGATVTGESGSAAGDPPSRVNADDKPGEQAGGSPLGQ